MTEPIFSSAVKATYTPQHIARMQGNPLIEALPAQMDDKQMIESLMLAPDFSHEQRDWSNHQRIQQIKGLGNFMLPLTRHLELARMLDTMMREGYVGRAPRTKEFVAKLQQIYELQKAGKTFAQTAYTVCQQDSASLLGASGMGKTTTVRRHLARYPRVIYHEELHITQVTYVHVDLSSDGNSVKSLAIAVIAQLDKLLPECGYHRLYLSSTGRTNTESLIHTMGRLLATHHVGLLVADEVQNLCNSPKGAQTVMTELVTMCNTLNVPILFIGTNKAAKVLSADFRQARRSTGMGIAPWTRLPRYDVDMDKLGQPGHDEPEGSEWAEFIMVLWQYQWVKKPLAISEEILDFVYRRTQGVLDLAIKLFAIAQARAILEGHETLSLKLLEQVYQNDFRLLHESIDALANDDFKTLSLYEDIAPVGLDDALADIAAKSLKKKAFGLLAKPGDAAFRPRMALAARAAGFSEEQAMLMAQEIEDDGIATNTAEGLHQIHAKSKPVSIKKAAKSSDSSKAPGQAPDLTDRPQDYRRVFEHPITPENDSPRLPSNFGIVQNIEKHLDID